MTTTDRGRQDPNCQARKHGTETDYQHGCRCPHARDDHRLYNKRRREGRNPNGKLDITGTLRRIQALARIGWPVNTIYQHTGRTGTPGGTLYRVGWVQRDHANDIRRVYDQLSMTPGPSATTRRRAERKGWPSPLEWEGVDIDDPNAQPHLDDIDAWNPMTDIDEVAVRAALSEHPSRRLGTAENVEAVRIAATRLGLSDRETADRIGITHRQVERIRLKHDIPAATPRTGNPLERVA